jgi:hypothetical protein
LNISSRINLQLGLEFNAAATESNELRVFGMRDQFTSALLYRFSKREYVQVHPVWARYYSQTGEFLGNGNHFSWEMGYQLRTESPDLKVRLTGIHTGFRNVPGASLALPGNVNIYGLCLGTGDSYRYSYTQAWRPNADFCATNNDLSGQGYNAGLGLAGSVAGHDQLSLNWRQESGGANVINGLSRELKLNYRYFY